MAVSPLDDFVVAAGPELGSPREVQATELVIHQVIGEAACLSFWIGDEPKLPAKRLTSVPYGSQETTFVGQPARTADGVRC